jgi:solute carrier family 35, member E3
MLDNLETFSQSIKASLMVLLLGVGIASVTDLQLNLLGSIIAVLTIAATCVGQIVSFCLLSSHELKKKKKLLNATVLHAQLLIFTLHVHMLGLSSLIFTILI